MKKIMSCIVAVFMVFGIMTPAPANAMQNEERSQTLAVQSVKEPVITSVRGGNRRAKIQWNKVSGADGYLVYMGSEDNVSYSLVANITDSTQDMYVKTGLAQNRTYSFYVKAYVKNSDGTRTDSDISDVVSVKTQTAEGTSTKAYKYPSQASFKRSGAYKQFSGFQKNLNYGKSFVVPGLSNTDVGGFSSTTMTPQAVCFAGGYILVSAYDQTGVDESVIYVLSKSSRSYITTIVLPDKTLANGLAYDGRNIWITGSRRMNVISYSEITAAVNSGNSYRVIEKYSGYVPLNMDTSFCTYYKNVLWVGSFKTSGTAKAYGFVASGTGSNVSLTQINKMSIPNRTRSMAFTSGGYMILTRSNRTNSASAGYISEMRTYKPALSKPSSNGTIAKKSVKKKITMPPLCTGIAVKGNFAYVAFSSSKYITCSYPVDRVIAFNVKKLQK